MISSRVSMSSSTSGGMVISLSAIGPALLLVTVVTAIMLLTSNIEVALVTVAAGAFCAFLFCVFLLTAPPFWLALLLIVLIPFHSLITHLLGGYESSTRQLLALWKEVLLGIGVFRVLRHNPNRKQIIASNRWVLVCSGLLMLMYLITFVRAPTLPGIFSLDLETRFLGVLLFFMFLDLDEKRKATLLRLMVWSVGLVALYGVVQYVWDYERLLPLADYAPNMVADDSRRLYSYSLNPFDPAFGAVIAILVLFSGAGRSALRGALLWFALLIPCLLLTYTRSAYLGLLAGIATVCAIDRDHVKRHAVMIYVTVCLICAALLFGGQSVYKSSLAQRVQSIVSQTDDSSKVHKQRLWKAVQVISTNPFGIGLGKYGTVQSRFVGGSEEADWVENQVLQVAVQTGVIGALAYLALTVAILVSILRKRHGGNKDVRVLRAAAGGVFVAMIVVGVMVQVWDDLLPAVYAWAIVGMALADGCAPWTRLPVALRLSRPDRHSGGKPSSEGIAKRFDT
jgi:O-antigen ligase